MALERKLGVDARVLNRSEVLELAPYVAARVIGAGFSPIEGKANPMLTTLAFARGALSAGAVLLTQTAVVKLEQLRGRVAVHTEGARVEADQVLLASGQGLAAHAAAFGARLPVIDKPVQVCATEPVAPLVSHLLSTPAVGSRSSKLAPARCCSGVVGRRA